jgi:cation diffusion facilitator family transporter
MAEASNENYEFQKIVAIVGVTLMAIKFLAYSLTSSVSILTDALESIVNVVAAFVGLYALYMSAKPADRDHPFGHGKMETISASVEGTLITIAGVLILIESVARLINPSELRDLDIGLVLIAVTAVVNLAVGRAAIVRGRKNRSSALEASGKHLCSDTVSSIGIIAGLSVLYAVEALGYHAPWLDPVIAIFFGLVIIRTGIKVIRECLHDVVDGADEELISDVADCLNEHRHYHWIDVYGLRIIKYGPRLYVDMHAVLPRNMPMEEAAVEISEVQQALCSKFGESTDVSITPVPCPEFICRYCEYECDRRTLPFERTLEWTAHSLCCTKPHGPDVPITIRLDETDKSKMPDTRS